MIYEQINDAKNIEYTDALEQHVFKSTDFFDEAFLDLLKRYFPFKHITVAAYDDDFHLISGIGSSREINRVGDDYLYHLSERDTTARYINNNFDSLEFNKDILYDGVEALSENDDCQDFRLLLNRYDFSHRAILPISRQYRISVFKKAAEGAFTPQEKASLHNLLVITRSKYESFIKLRAYQKTSKIKSNMLDSLKVGYITLNREFQVIDFNSYGIECMMKLWNAQSISEALRKLRSSPEMRGLHDGQMEYQGQIITGHSFSEMDFYGRLQQYYYYTMTAKTTTQTEKPHSELPFELLSSRELEVLDAFSRGLEYREICEQLFISEGTVRTHLKSIYRKLNINNQRKMIYDDDKYLK